jgi:hypothetical protein
MSDIFKKPEKEPLPDPEPPVAIGETGEGDTTKKKMAQRSGQSGGGKSILAGELTPSTKKKKVLG